MAAKPEINKKKNHVTLTGTVVEIKMKQCSVADTKTVPEFGVLGGVIFKLDIL